MRCFSETSAGFKVQVQVILRPTVSRPVCFCFRTSMWGSMTRFLLLSDIWGLHVVGHPPWREGGSVIYSYNLLSLFSPSPAELMTTSYRLIWDQMSLSHTRLPQAGGPSSCIYILPRDRVAQLYPRALGLLPLNWLHGVISQMIVHFITTAVRASSLWFERFHLNSERPQPLHSSLRNSSVNIMFIIIINSYNFWMWYNIA
jgi:hypothetical protein